MYPSGKIITITPELKGGIDNSGTLFGYYSNFQFSVGLSDPVGQYKVQITASGGRHAQTEFTIIAVKSPRIRYLSSEINIDHYILYGFKPEEKVLISMYKHVGNYDLVLNGWEYITVDQNGERLIDLPFEVPAFTKLELSPDPIVTWTNENSEVMFAKGNVSGKVTFVPYLPIVDTPTN
jgi:hypothetical protein